VQYAEGVNVGYRWYQAKNITPLFPFGFGLSYTNFAYSNLSVSPLDAHGKATVTATVTNTGARAGSDVAQLYVGDPATTGEPPKQLKGFTRVTLNPGASTTVSFPVTLHDLAFWNDSTSSWTTATGTYGMFVGNTSASPQLSGTLAVNSTSAGNTVTVANPQGMSSPVGTAASMPITATDSAGGQTMSWTASGLPAGLSINSGSGVISGTATTAGTSTVTVTATDGTGATGTTSFVWSATTPSATAPPGSGPIVAGVSASLCVDVRAANSADNTPVQIFTCNGTGAQNWTVSGSTLQALGKCLDVAGAGTANSTKDSTTARSVFAGTCTSMIESRPPPDTPGPPAAGPVRASCGGSAGWLHPSPRRFLRPKKSKIPPTAKTVSKLKNAIRSLRRLRRLTLVF